MNAWTSWKPEAGGYGFAKRSTRAHFGPVEGGPAECGTWIPYSMDANTYADPHGRRCQKCEKALAKKDAAAGVRDEYERHEVRLDYTPARDLDHILDVLIGG